MFAEQGRLDAPEEICWFTLDEINAANADPNFDLQQVKKGKQSFYRRLNQVIAFPHMIDSRGRAEAIILEVGGLFIENGFGMICQLIESLCPATSTA